MITPRARPALMVAGLVALGAVAWVIMSAIGGASASRERSANALSLEGIRTTLATVHGTGCDAGDAAHAFDFREIARRTLGRHWHDRTEAERRESVALLSAHFLRRYSRLCERHDHVHFELPIADGNRAVILARAIRDGRDVAIVYRLQSSDMKRWFVYDVDVAGHSRTRSTYSDLDRIILTEGYRVMIEQLAADLETRRP